MKTIDSKISLYIKRYKTWLFLCGIICLFNSALSILIGDYIRKIIDLIVEKQESVTPSIIFTGIIIVISGVIFVFLRTYCTGRFGVHICSDLRKRIALKIRSLPMKTIEENHSGEIISRINFDLPVIQSFFNETIPSFIYYPAILLGTSIYLAFIDWRLLLITTCLIPLTIFISTKMGKPVKKYAKAWSESSAKETAVAKDIISGIYVNKAFNLQETVFAKYKTATDDMIGNYYTYEKKLAILTPFNMIIRLVPFFFCFIFGGYFAVNNWITTGSLYAFIYLLNNLIWPMAEIPTFVNKYRTFTVSLDRIEEILNKTEERKNGDSFECEADTAIEFKNVNFTYGDENGNNIHNSLSFKIPSGKLAALVGTSGCGKTTVLKEICGFCKPQEGNILIFNKDIEQWSMEGLRRNLAFISQESFLYPVTVMENISYGRENAGIEEIYKAAKAANAHDFIMKLPNGYNTMVGEKGINLSGGQKQRICIARAILKDAKVLLMDEPTSSLDTQSETLIEDAVLSNRNGKTIILIAHRFSTIKSADIILVMDKGRIAEEGSYAELIEKDGLFRKLYMKQCGEL